MRVGFDLQIMEKGFAEMTKYTDIIARLSAATGSDSELDRAILASVGYTWRGLGMGYWHKDDSHMFSGSPSVTHSIDASIALVERMLPGAELEMTNLYGVARVTLHDVEYSFHGEDLCNRLQTALLIALFRALEAKEETP